jgi:hypothetical protein
MSMERQPYVRPFVMRLDYSTDNRVSMAQVCKQEGSATGAIPSSCVGAPDTNIPCVEIVS